MTAVLGGRPQGLTSLALGDDDIDTRARLVVVGNGMAGARFVEEVLERGGGEHTAQRERPGGPSGQRPQVHHFDPFATS